MKKVITNITVPIKFRVNGSLLLDIDSEGVIVNDTDAALIVERLGSQVIVTDAAETDVPAEETPVAPVVAESSEAHILTGDAVVPPEEPVVAPEVVAEPIPEAPAEVSASTEPAPETPIVSE